MKNNLDFILIGPQRTGTSFLYSLLSKSNEISLPKKVKELYYFESGRYPDDEWLKKHLDFNSSKKCGLVSPTCFVSETAFRNILSYSNDIKIVITYRNPVELILSLHRHHLSKGRVSKNLKDAIRKDPSILHSGKYGQYSEMWKKGFGDNVLILPFSDLKKSPNLFIKKLCNHIGVSSDFDYSIDAIDKNRALLPYSKFLASLATRSAQYLRNNGHYAIINNLKKLGLKAVYSGKGVFEHSNEDKEFIFSQLSDSDFLNIEFENYE